jgi:redox-sensitive bicupin YhaK (pirin superfamily)
VLAPGQSATHALPKGRHAWLQMLRGSVSVNGRELAAGDGLAASNEPKLEITAGDEKTEFLAFDLV